MGKEEKEIVELALAQLHYENIAILGILEAIIQTEGASAIIRQVEDDFESKYIQIAKKN